MLNQTHTLAVGLRSRSEIDAPERPDKNADDAVGIRSLLVVSEIQAS